jgi:ankyrin repeat protein
VEACDNRGRTPLTHAILENREPIVKLLLAMGAGVDACDPQGITPLAHAVLENHEAIVKLLMESGADLKARDARGTCICDTRKLNRHLEVTAGV